MERTFAIIKPDAVARQATGPILGRIEEEGFRVVGLRKLHLTLGQAEGFYAVHHKRPFFKDLTAFMSSGPVVVLALERDDAVAHWRRVIGNTDSSKAEPGTLRHLFGTDIEQNAVHGSDALETARTEIGYFFSALDLVG